MLEHFYGIGCDGPDCPNTIGGGYPTSKAARRAATKARWTRVKGDKWTARDYCQAAPKHAPGPPHASWRGIPVRSPQRIQLSRRAGWRKPADAVVVARPTKWGNPFLVSPVAASFPSLTERQVAQFVVNDFHSLVRRGTGQAARGRRLSSPEYEDVTYPSADEIRAELAGKDLACWCALDQPCHADVLLAIANRSTDADAD